MTALEVSRADRLRVFERDGMLCAASSPDPEVRACYGDLTIQHRCNRSVVSAANRNVLPNLLALCWRCNMRLEGDSAFAALGRKLGWKIESWEDPFTTAVYVRWALEWRLLDGSGGWARVSARTAEERAALGGDAFADWREKS